jgi:hypothetical protein
MNTRRSSLILAVSCVFLLATPTGRAQDTGVDAQLAKIKRCLPGDDGRPADLKGLKAAASSLTEKWPTLLDAPGAQEEKKEYQVDDATADQPATPRLALTESQRLALLNAYQDYAESIAAIAKRRPFDPQAAEDIKGAVSALREFMTRLESLLPMDSDSSDYRRAVEKLVNEERRKSK